MINLDKPVISAINGVAVGAGLVVALMSDISIISETARFTDGHTRLGVVAGDHAAIVWPLLCGMAKAKYYLLTSDFIDGARPSASAWSACACRPRSSCRGPSRWPTSSPPAPSRPSAGPSARLNNWLRMAGPIFDQSIALEMLTFMDEDVREGAAAIREKRAPRFPSAQEPPPASLLSSRSSFPRRAASHPDAQTRQYEGGPA